MYVCMCVCLCSCAYTNVRMYVCVSNCWSRCARDSPSPARHSAAVPWASPGRSARISLCPDRQARRDRDRGRHSRRCSPSSVLPCSTFRTSRETTPPTLRMRSSEQVKFVRPPEITRPKMAREADNSLYPIAVLIDELRNDDVQVRVHGKRGPPGGVGGGLATGGGLTMNVERNRRAPTPGLRPKVVF